MAEAPDAAAKSDFDVVISDLGLPEALKTRSGLGQARFREDKSSQAKNPLPLAG